MKTSRAGWMLILDNMQAFDSVRRDPRYLDVAAAIKIRR